MCAEYRALHNVIPRAGGESIRLFFRKLKWIPRINRGMTIFFISALMILTPALAEPPVIPPQKTQSLEILKNKLADEEDQKARLAKQAKQAEKDIAATKSGMVDLSAKIRKNEDGLHTLEKRVQELSAQEQDLTKKLEADHGSMASTILALERMRRIPPELLIVRPGAPLETAQTALLLQNLLPALNQRAESLSHDIKNLNDVREKLASDQKKLLTTKADLEKQNKALAGMMVKREKDFKSANAAYKSSTARAERIAAEAQSLAELVSRIEDDPAPVSVREYEPPAPRKKQAHSKAGGRPGKGVWPVSGRALARYGDYDDMGAEIKGLKISAASKAIVIAPMQGTVKYAGTFRNYGHLVILDHANGYHSLIAGMSRPQIGIGQTIKAGEPLGYMPSSSSQDGPLTLYYELRRDGEPIDPSYLFSDLKS